MGGGTGSCLQSANDGRIAEKLEIERQREVEKWFHCFAASLNNIQEQLDKVANAIPGAEEFLTKETWRSKSGQSASYLSNLEGWFIDFKILVDQSSESLQLAKAILGRRKSDTVRSDYV